MRSVGFRGALLSRLVAVASSSLVGCGSSGSSNVDQSTPSGNAGSNGAGGSAAGSGGSGGSSGGSGGSSGGSSGSGGSSSGGGGGSGGSGGSGGGTLVCDPATGKGNDGAPPLHCQSTGPVGPPPGCSATIGMGGSISCYVPGSSGSPSGTCLPMDDAGLGKLLGQGCGGVIDKVTGAPECRVADAMGTPAQLSCCYPVTFTATCQARPFLVADRLRVAAAVRRTDWRSVV